MDIEQILGRFKTGELGINEASRLIDRKYLERAESVTIDGEREERTGVPEVIYGLHKTPDQVLQAFKSIAENGSNVLATRITRDVFEVLEANFENVEFSETAELAMMKQKPVAQIDTLIGVITAGTSDLRVAEEAALTAEFFGSSVVRINDVGVAGIHRLMTRLELLKQCRVLVVVAGMEGALPSVVGGLVECPVIAVPTSVGYGAALEGFTALFGMLTSCASGVAVVNIDNGFGAGLLAHKINKL
ncbi:1-(5-phosphoribosyl)-5-amino-4-imidazole-carboxylate carboxylase [Candidatus Poribacteria bacterium]|nr:MAG: 1-(5-phosphoribosyl)-5-amino-4-imidazole-carboxylate carboxylase [Candidatus Poribacteria bacterium]